MNKFKEGDYEQRAYFCHKILAELTSKNWQQIIKMGLVQGN